MSPDEVPAHKIKSKLEELRDGEVFADQQPDANVVVAMGEHGLGPWPSFWSNLTDLFAIWLPFCFTAIMEVLQSCVSTKRPSIVEVALECLHRLVIYKFVHGQVIGLMLRALFLLLL